jgi:hypothetical protein
MKFKSLFLMPVFLLLITMISCVTAKIDEKVVLGKNKAPGPEYDYLGKIYLGGHVVSGGGDKIANSTALTGLSEEHAVKRMKDLTYDVGGNYLIIDSMDTIGSGENMRYMGVGRAYKLRESYGTVGKKTLTEKGHMVQFVKRMEPGPDYEVVASAKADNGSASGPKGEISAAAESEDETIIVMRNVAADLGGSLLVVDGIEKDDSKKPAMFNGKGRVFKMKK